MGNKNEGKSMEEYGEEEEQTYQVKEEENEEGEEYLERNSVTSYKKMSKFSKRNRRKKRQLLPTPPTDVNKMTIVLDLDETLIHSSFDSNGKVKSSFTFNVEIDGKDREVNVWARPYLMDFLRCVHDIFEVVVFTASLKKYADPLLDHLDPKRELIQHRLFRDSCTLSDGFYKKDISLLGRSLSKIIIVDNSPLCYDLQPENAVAIPSFIDDPNDDHLLKLIPWLIKVSEEGDVYDILTHIRVYSVLPQNCFQNVIM